MSLALAAHVLRGTNAFEPANPPALAALGRFELSRLSGYIEANIDRTITLAELAALVNVSRFHFTRLFKRGTGVTAIGFVERCRIRRAQALILESDLTLVEVALMTGFADPSHSPGVSAGRPARRRPPLRASTVAGAGGAEFGT